MDGNDFAPDDEGAGEHEQAEIGRVFFLEANQEFAEAIDKRVSNFHDPAPCLEVRIAFKLQLFFAARADVSGKPALFHFLLRTDEACVEAEVLRMLARRQRTKNHNVIKGFRQQLDVVDVRARRHDRDGQAMALSQKTAFRPVFFPYP